MELTEFEKDLMLVGMISQSISNQPLTESSRHTNTARKADMFKILYGSKRICRYEILKKKLIKCSILMINLQSI